jgi:hypothetical protein
MSFLRHKQIYQSDEKVILCQERTAFGFAPGLIVSMSLRPVIPWRVALQCGSDAIGQNDEGTWRDNGVPRSAVVGRQCNGAQRSPFFQCGPELRGQNSGDASLSSTGGGTIPIGRLPDFTTRTADSR